MNFIDTPEGDDLEPFRVLPALADALNNGADRPSWTDSALRNLMAQRTKNGLDRFVIKTGKKLLISEPGFRFWLRQHSPYKQLELSLKGGPADEIQ